MHQQQQQQQQHRTAKSSMSSKVGYGFSAASGRIESTICHRPLATCNWAEYRQIAPWHRRRFRFATTKGEKERAATLLACCIHSFSYSFTHSLAHSFSRAFIQSFIIDRSAMLKAIVCNRISVAAISQSCVSPSFGYIASPGYMIRLFIVLWLGY